MFAGVFAWRAATADAEDAVALLYVVPVGLVALELGLLGGVTAAALATALLGGWILASGAPVGVLGVVTRAVTFVTVGLIAGRFSDRMRAAQVRHGRLLESGLVLAHLQSSQELPATLAAEARRVVGAHSVRVDTVEGVAESGRERGGDCRQTVMIEVRGSRYGSLTVSSARPIGEEGMATLSMLAAQAAVAAENHRLLESERERVLIQHELEDARARLARGQGQLRELIVRQEAERGDVAHELHEDAAQVLTAVQLGLRALERELGAAPAKPHLLSLRSEVNTTLKSLRALAVRLRPPVLRLGLGVALEELAAGPQAAGFEHISIDLSGIHALSSETETMVYRVVEETVRSVSGARLLSIRTVEDGAELAIDVEQPSGEIGEDRLTILGARLDLAGGSLAVSHAGLHAVLPLGPGRGGPSAHELAVRVGTYSAQS
jgi:signal transduction histidine kinase